MLSDVTFTKVYPSESRQQMRANLSLDNFCNGVGIPLKIKNDRDQEFCRRNSEFLKYAKQKRVYLTSTEPERKNKIVPIGVDIRKLRNHTHNKLKATNNHV